MRAAMFALIVTAAAMNVAAQPNRADEGPRPLLRIPGLPPVPMPPGTSVFPDRDQSGAPATEVPNARSARDSTGPSSPGQPFVDDLFRRLRAASDAQEAEGIAGAIQRYWLRSGSDTADLLMSRAMAAMQARENDLALTLLGRIVELEPGWAEAWNKRATLRFEMDDVDASMEDIRRVLALEPRHFGALAGMGIILQREGFDKRALEAFRRVLEIYPALESIRQIHDKLTIEVEGRGI